MKELFSGFRRKETHEPVMKKKGDVYLFGITHEVTVPDEAPLKYVNRVLRAKHLLLEGRSDAYGPDLPQDYENTAYGLFQYRKKEGDVHFLEEGTDDAAQLTDYGVDGKDAIVYLSYVDLLAELGTAYEAGNGANLREGLDGITDDLQRKNPSLRENTSLKTTVVDALSRMNSLLLNGSQEANAMVRGVGVLLEYQSDIRDSDVLAPKISQLNDELKGKKALFVGEKHLPNMEKAIRGEKVAKPRPWGDHVKSLPEEDRHAVKVFQRVSQGKAI